MSQLTFQLTLRKGRPARVTGVIVQAIAVAAFSWLTQAQASDAAADPDSADRSIAFVEKSVDATELFNQQKLPEALAAFQSLLQDYGDLDEDGYVAMSLADCLHAVGRNDEARAMYQSVATAHPTLAEAVQHRLRELSLSGEPDDALLNQLRTAAAGAVEDAYSVKVQLGRALQKRAVGLLKEAIAAFREAAETEPNLAQPTRRLVGSQTEMLAEIQEDLTSLIQRMDRAWGAMSRLSDWKGMESDAAPAGLYRAEWTQTANGQPPVKFEISWDECGIVNVNANGRAVPLNPTQRLVIRRHQERINAILMEAMQAAPAEPAPRR